MQNPTIDCALDMILHEGRGAIENSGKIFGVVPAIVINDRDDKGPKRHQMGMLQVFFPWMTSRNDPACVMPWVRMVMPDAGGDGGKEAGFYSPPQIGDEVLVAFEQGDPHFGYALGSMWNARSPIPLPITPLDGQNCPGHHPGGPAHVTPDLTPQTLGGNGGKNKIYFWRSRTGNLIILDDDQGTVRIVERTGNSVLQCTKGDLHVLSKKGDIFVYAAKTINVQCNKFEVHTKSSVFMEAGKDWTVSCGSTEKGTGHATMDVGATFDAKANMKFTATSNEHLVVHAKGNVTLKSLMDMNFQAAEKNLHITAKKGSVDLMSMMDMTLASKNGKLNVLAKQSIMFNSLMEMNITANGGDVNAKAGVIMMN